MTANARKSARFRSPPGATDRKSSRNAVFPRTRSMALSRTVSKERRPKVSGRFPAPDWNLDSKDPTMDFSISEESRMLVDTVRRFVQEKVQPLEGEVEKLGRIPDEKLKALKSEAKAQIGRASSRERVCQDVSISGVA